MLGALRARYPWRQAARHRARRGIADALRTGYLHARGDVLVFLPGRREIDDVAGRLGRVDAEVLTLHGGQDAAQQDAVLGGTVVVGVCFVALNLLSDILYRVLDPRAT